MTSAKATVLVVDDEPHILKALATRLEAWHFEVETAQTGYGALERMALRPYDAVILDVMMPLVDGIETLKRAKKLDDRVPIIMLTAYEDDDLIRKAMSLGAFDFLTKPFENEKIQEMLEKALVSRGLPPPADLALRSYLKDRYRIENLIKGETAQVRRICALVNRVKDADIAVLIQGESGTGKELIARAIHFNGVRMEKPFICVSCAAIPETLLESELFGHEKGAFTDAKAARKGRFEQAHGGTLFLDEVGEMSLATQAKVLRVLEEKTFERLGGNESISVNVRIVSATNKDLSREVEEGSFRSDLYYRINAFPIYLPPLRERREDIPVLVDHFIDSFNRKMARNVESVSSDAMSLLVNHEWKGNIRELENVIERAFVLADADILTEAEFPTLDGAASAQKGPAEPPRTLEDLERDALAEALAYSSGNVSRAARILGIGRPTFYRKARKYGIDIRNGQTNA